MINTTLRTSRLASNLLNQAVAFRFSFNWAPMDPRKHTTMSHHPHNIYLDLYDYGHYPDFYHICSTAPRTYEPQVINILVATLNARYVCTASCRERRSMLSFFFPSASGNGIGSFPRTSKLRKNSMMFILHS